MRLSDLDYELPESQIARWPLERRDASRLLCLRRDSGSKVERSFADLADVLRPGDLVVRNETRVRPARLRGVRPSGGSCEVLLLRRENDPSGGPGELWSCLAKPAKRLRVGESATLADGRIVVTWESGSDDWGVRTARLVAERPISCLLAEQGELPLPPYVRRAPDADDPVRYQTTYARVEGSAAAPTAGLHFTPRVDAALAARGVEIAPLTLHVGVATFVPLRDDAETSTLQLPPEDVEIPPATVAAIDRAKREERRVVAVGTTTVRALEGSCSDGVLRSGPNAVSLAIVPGHSFAIVDAMITNFHLPRTSLLALVCAFAGQDLVLDSYRQAVRDGFRFYSFGDAMLIE